MEEDLLTLLGDTESINRNYLHYDYIKKLSKYFSTLDTIDFFMALLIMEYFPGSLCNKLKKRDINKMYDATYKLYTKDTTGTLINPAYLVEMSKVMKEIKEDHKEGEKDK